MVKKSAKLKIDSHQLIPKHSKLSEKDKKALLVKYNINVRELPKMFKGDTAIAHLDITVGDVIKIERESFTAGKSIFYRGVIND